MKQKIIEIQNLKKYFRNRGNIVKAVDNISFTVHEGEVIGLIGESGSGKTTVGRSLIRLYDDYSGNVKVLGQTVSGRKIAKEKQRFLRKNVQMIFQDPHSSLNSQKTVFSIIREPLVVNKIIKDETKEIFKNWKEVTYYFKHTLNNAYLKAAAALYIKTNKSLSLVYEKAQTRLQTLNLEEISNNTDHNLNDIFNALVDPLNAIQAAKSSSIKNLYTIQDQLYNQYFKAQARYLKNDLDLDEKNLVAAQKALRRAKINLKETDQSLKLLAQKKAMQEKNRKDQAELKDKLRNRTNLLNSLVADLRNEYLLERSRANRAPNQATYLFHLKRTFTYGHSGNIIAPRLNWIAPFNFISLTNPLFKHLDVDNIQKLFDDLFQYHRTFIKANWALNLDLPLAKQIKDYIKKNYHFDFNKYLDKAQSFKTATVTLSSEAKLAISKIKKAIKNLNRVIDHQKMMQLYQKAQAHYQKVWAEHREQINKYTAKQEKINRQMETIYLKEKKRFKKHLGAEKEVFAVFKKDLINFKNLATNLYQKRNLKVKEIKNLLKDFENKAQEKMKTLKKFNSEFKFLTKDIKILRFFFGHYKNALTSFLKYPLEKYLVSKLLIKKTIYNALEAVGLLRQFAYRYPHEFSGGQRQRIVIARALVTKPKLLIADEPIASLDISIQAQIVNLLRLLGRENKIGIIFIAHDLSMVEYIANRTIIMHLGKIVEEGNTNKIYQKPLHPYTINLFKSIPKISNANQKFISTSFALEYLEAQSFPNVIVRQEIEKEHYLFGTEAQIKTWVPQ